jgi:hypothetical protein
MSGRFERKPARSGRAIVDMQFGQWAQRRHEIHRSQKPAEPGGSAEPEGVIPRTTVLHPFGDADSQGDVLRVRARLLLIRVPSGVRECRARVWHDTIDHLPAHGFRGINGAAFAKRSFYDVGRQSTAAPFNDVGHKGLASGRRTTPLTTA